MACKADVKQAILNEVFKELVDGRYTFIRISDDSLTISNRADSKARTTEQAKAIANELAKRAEKSFLGHVKGEVSQLSPYDPVTVKFTPTQAYIDHVYNTLPPNQRTDGKETDNERNYINTNSGPNTYNQLELFDVDDSPATGVFAKFIQFKKTQLQKLRDRLNEVKGKKKDPNISTDELTRLNNLEKKLKLDIEGNFDLGIKGLRQEIAELMKNADINAVGYYVEKDLKRLEDLVNSDNLEDLQEAEDIIKFYQSAGTFIRNVENPFFSQEEIFFEDDNGGLSSDIKLTDEVLAKYKEWADRASKFTSTIIKKHEEVIVNIVNSNPLVQKTHNKNFTFNELFYTESGLKDVDWISMWTMDITHGIFSDNGLIPQVSQSYLEYVFDKKLARDAEIHRRIDELTPKVAKELIRLGYTLRGGGIVGPVGASFEILKEKTKEGNDTGGLIQRFTREFFDASSKALDEFSNNFSEAISKTDDNERRVAINKAFEKLRSWRRSNTIIMDINRLPEFSTTQDTTHKDELIAILGQKGYDQQVARQKKLLQKFDADKQSTLETLLASEGKDTFDELSDEGKFSFTRWETNHSPYKGIEDFGSVNGIAINNMKTHSFMDYNNFIPRKTKVTPSADIRANTYSYIPTTVDTGFYSKVYQDVIENNPILSEFYDLTWEVLKDIRENMPYELQAKMAVNTIPALMKTSSEIIADKNHGVLSSVVAAYRNLIERIRLSFGVTKQSEISYATIDPVTGKANYRVNDSFLRGNSQAIANLMVIEKTKFLQALNAGRAPDNKVKAIRRFSSFPLDSLNEESLILLAQYLHISVPIADIKARRLDAFRNITGNDVQIGKYIRDFATHTIVQSQSFDLPKVLKYFSTISKIYAARQEALPVLEIVKKHYEGIKQPKTTNLQSNVRSALSGKQMVDGLRVFANKQYEDWFERVVLGNYDTKHIGPYGKDTKIDKLLGKGNIGTKTDFSSISGGLKVYKDIYSTEEKQRIKEINELLKHEQDEDKRKQLEGILASMGKTRTATAFFDNFLSWIRMLGLGYNLSSGVTNFVEGLSSNMIIASTGQFFDPKEIYYGYGIVKHSFLKNVSFGKAETGKAKKNRVLMDRFNVIMDSRNELQRSSTRSYADKLNFLNPYALNQRVEFVNQSPIMIAMLRTEKIKDRNGNESSVWDAMDNNGKLKGDFRTEENVQNWEELTGQQYLNFKQKLNEAIVITHGNYHELRGMMIKSNSAGKAAMMFKGWLPNMIFTRFAAPQDNIQMGVKGYKGRYRSYSGGSALLHGAVVGAAMFGPIGAAIGAAVGLGAGSFFGTNRGDTVGVLKDTVISAKFLAKKMIGMPINTISGVLVSRKIMDDGSNAFEEWVGKGNFTAQDARNMRGNMSDIALQLAWLAMMLAVKGLFWDDEDEKDSPERIAHNILVNRLLQLSSQASMYVNPVEFGKTVSSLAVLRYFKDLGKEIDRVQKYIDGKDIIASGPNQGQSGLWLQTKKVFLPGLFKDGSPIDDLTDGKIPSLGFKNQGERVFKESPWHEYFKSDKKIDEETNKGERAGRKLELQEQFDIDQFEGDTVEEKQKAMDKEIKRILNEELPTPNALKKLNMTREEFEKSKQ